jgi:hypothetical protein
MSKKEMISLLFTTNSYPRKIINKIELPYSSYKVKVKDKDKHNYKHRIKDQQHFKTF